MKKLIFLIGILSFGIYVCKFTHHSDTNFLNIEALASSEVDPGPGPSDQEECYYTGNIWCVKQSKDVLYIVYPPGTYSSIRYY